MMSDEQAHAYLEYLESHRRPVPNPSRERGFLQRHPPQSLLFTDTYGYSAALLAYRAHDDTAGPRKRIGEYIRAANVGLVLAYHKYIENDETGSFKSFAKPFVLRELEQLKEK
jgi:hypothetical protein